MKLLAGVGLLTRLAGATVSPVVQVTETNGVYKMITTSPFKNQMLEFRLGEEFEEVTPDGRTVKSVITMKDNKMTHLQKGDKQVVIEREFKPDEMVAIMKVDDIVCTRVYKLEN